MALLTSSSGGLRRRAIAAALGILAVLAAQGAMGAPVRAATGPPVIRTHPMIPVPAPVGPAESPESNGFQQSTNWSGYDLSGAFSGITGCWNVPSVTSSTGPTYSSAWIGMDGVSNTDLIQTGTEQDWSSTTGLAPYSAQYFAWWEILPAPATLIPMSITPGDAMCASIIEVTPTGRQISLNDVTTGTQFSTTQTYTGPEDSAEWIVEAPDVTTANYSCAPCNLADYGATTFHSTTVNPFSNPSLIPADGLEMVQHGNLVSVPSDPGLGQNAFTVAYGSIQPLAPGQEGGGYTLDAYGGVHPFGDSPSVTTTGYWPGWTIARSIAMNPCDADGQYSGWVMDGFGGLHPFAGAGTPMPTVPYTTGYWPGWTIANDFVAFCITVGGVQHAAGCVLDGFGGLHAWADSSAVIGDVSCNGTGYWPGWDIATKITVIPGTDQGYVMDGFGGLHPFNSAPDYSPSGYWPGWEIAAGVVATANGGYTVDGFGGIHPFGSAPAITPSGYWPGWDIVTAIAMASGGTGAYTLDGFGGVHPAGGAPSLSVTGYWPGWDVAIDIAAAP
ncbi:MAG: G1 family glutamic endopeptidase [Candidatus Dormibacteria bacterium]|jgi:hypothetical protein